MTVSGRRVASASVAGKAGFNVYCLGRAGFPGQRCSHRSLLLPAHRGRRGGAQGYAIRTHDPDPMTDRRSGQGDPFASWAGSSPSSGWVSKNLYPSTHRTRAILRFQHSGTFPDWYSTLTK